MFWAIFYWSFCAAMLVATCAISFFEWMPEQKYIAWAAFIGVAMAAHALAKSYSTGSGR